MGLVCDTVCPKHDGNPKVSILRRRFPAVFRGRIKYFHDILQTRTILRAHSEAQFILNTFREETRLVPGLRPPWRWKKQASFERQQLFTVRHGVLYRYTWTFLNTAVRSPPPIVSQ